MRMLRGAHHQPVPEPSPQLHTLPVRYPRKKKKTTRAKSMQGECQVRWELPQAVVAKHKCGAAGTRCGSVEETSLSPAPSTCPARAGAACTAPHWDTAKADGAGDGETIQPVIAVGEGRFLSSWDGRRAAPPPSDGDAAALVMFLTTIYLCGCSS